jgi:CheY-like chemotaxis protein/Tfp pilus assembly protein PilZ
VFLAFCRVASVNGTTIPPIAKIERVAANARRGRDQRLVSRCRVEFERPSGWVEAVTEDLSQRGLFIRTEALLPVGEETELRVTLPDGTYLGLRARVAHMLTPSAATAVGRHAGLGFELTGPESTSRLKLRAYLESLRTEITSPGFVAASAQVVVVEPSAPMRTRLKGALESAGFQVTAVPSAPEALQRCTGFRPDVVVAASAMDAMTGIDLAYAMAEHATLYDVPLVLTGDEGDLGRLEAFRAGIRDYVPRPFVDEELVIRVHRIASAGSTTNPGLRGSLVDIGLGTLLSLLEYERKSGILMVLRQGEIARVFVADGRMLRVEASFANGVSTPKDRLMRLLDWRDGQFEFSPATITGRDEVGISVTVLLLEHARTRDEEKSGPISNRR